MQTTPGLAGVRQVAALSVDEPLLRRLREGGSFTGKVHSAFDRVVNIEVGGGSLVSGSLFGQPQFSSQSGNREIQYAVKLIF